MKDPQRIATPEIPDGPKNHKKKAQPNRHGVFDPNKYKCWMFPSHQTDRANAEVRNKKGQWTK